MKVSGAETFVTFSLQDTSLAPYRIDNLTRHQLLVTQSACAELEHPRIIEEVLRLRAPHTDPHCVLSAECTH